MPIRNLLSNQSENASFTGEIPFINRLDNAVWNARQAGRDLAVICLCMCGLESLENRQCIMDKLGVLLESSLGGDDTIILSGTDEYTILTQDRCGIFLSRIMDVFEHPIFADHLITKNDAGIGCAFYPLDGEDGKVVFTGAKKAMHRAKEAGGGHIVFCKNALGYSVLEDIQFTYEMHQALQQNHFELYYQPQIDILSGEAIGFEALIRFNHPELGVVEPQRFIPIAEKTGYIRQIGDWVIQTACKQNRIWMDEGLQILPISINLSAFELQDDLADKIHRALIENKLLPRYLAVEITESMTLGKMDLVAELFRRVGKLGVGIAIDDFGVGCSSLYWLKNIPANMIKLDQSFIKGIGKNARDEAILKSTIAMAKDIGICTIAEGVETGEQLDFLRLHGCHLVQGYYYYKPMPACNAKSLLKN